MKRWLGRFSVPVLFVTHDRSEAAALGERILTLAEGRIVQFAKLEPKTKDNR